MQPPFTIDHYPCTLKATQMSFTSKRCATDRVESEDDVRNGRNGNIVSVGRELADRDFWIFEADYRQIPRFEDLLLPFRANFG